MAILVTSSYFIIPWVVGKKMVSSIEKGFKNCKVRVGHVHLSYFPFSVTFEDPHLDWGDPKATGVEAKADDVVVDVSFRRLLLGEFTVEKIRIQRPVVVVTEGDLQMPVSHDSEED